ncbi:hypothetical protein WH50_18400 [Pokkaliibacter plantistimulans]|uniref:Uncharacterized protein n=1 Tax=Pokkaliibacter plantistimulans TaxID=1635171 RepID=A0ABX5LW75_9GAMM|nr:hypothetical protein [Pokkaliibacter plantistimulans]PXF29870.1 hypothetical protein WH50_18400 [Pokkaliibacter plantistimulans]
MDWSYNTIWYEQLEEGKFYHTVFNQTEKAWSVPNGGAYFVIDDFKPKSKCFSELKGLDHPVYLKFNRSNITDFRGIDSFRGVKRLELNYCIKLENDAGISDLSQDLEWLHIGNSRKFVITDEIRSLSKLKVLCLNDCAPIENLDFIHDFPELVDLRFVGTNVVDGNLRKLYESETLLNVAFSDKNHFDCRYEELSNFIQLRAADAKSPVYSNGRSTFKYNLF